MPADDLAPFEPIYLNAKAPSGAVDLVSLQGAIAFVDTHVPPEMRELGWQVAIARMTEAAGGKPMRHVYGPLLAALAGEGWVDLE